MRDLHEVSLMKNILKVAEDAAFSEGPEEKITLIHMKIGEMSGVCVESLRFAFEVLSKGTVSEDADLDIEKVPLLVSCGDCGARFKPREFTFICTRCGSKKLNVESGREMEIDYILTDGKPSETRKGS